AHPTLTRRAASSQAKEDSLSPSIGVNATKERAGTTTGGAMYRLHRASSAGRSPSGQPPALLPIRWS
ncbi:MAG: hypothetical protein ACRDHX_01575, partial [Chloroflexota bacterium]